MRLWYTIVNIIGVVFLSFLIMMFYNVDNVINKQFEELRLREAVDYATEAAFMSTLEVYNIGIDYDDIEGVNINPSYCLDTFKALICMNYNIALSEENFAHIENYIPVAVLMCNDGFYVAQMQEVDDRKDDLSGGNYDLHWNMKKPYTYKVKTSDAVSETNPLYSFNLNSQKWTSVFAKNNVVRINYGETYPSGVTKKTVSKAITTKVTQEINYAIKVRNDVQGVNSSSSFYLPSDLTASGINTLDKPSLLIMMQNVDLGRGGKVNAISLGGAKTERRRVVVGFTDDGINYYCYEKQLPEIKLGKVVDFYDSVEEAAEAGYSPHYLYLGNSSRERE